VDDGDDDNDDDAPVGPLLPEREGETSRNYLSTIDKDDEEVKTLAQEERNG